jgi:hypothetical protein
MSAKCQKRDIGYSRNNEYRVCAKIKKPRLRGKAGASGSFRGEPVMEREFPSRNHFSTMRDAQYDALIRQIAALRVAVLQEKDFFPNRARITPSASVSIGLEK